MDLAQPGIQRVVEAASRKGVALDIRLLPGGPCTSEQAAAALDAELGQMVEAMVFVAPRPEGRLIPLVCLVSGANQVDLSLLAAVSGEFAIRAASAREVRELTGFSPDAIPPIGYGREVRILMDQDLCQYQWIWAAAGSGTAVFKVAPRTLRMLSNAVVAPVAIATWMSAAAAATMEPRLQFETGAGA